MLDYIEKIQLQRNVKFIFKYAEIYKNQNDDNKK